jgi:hypothetical protein
MAGINWVGIGSATADHGFMGNFDGNGYKFKNLTITNPALDSDGYAYAGLFAVTEGTDKNNQNIIKNLTIENVTINTTGHIVSAAIAYPYYTIVENVNVCGDINITGGNYTAGALAYTRRCVNASDIAVIGNTGSKITGAQTVGGVISDIQMNGGLIADYSDFSAQNLTITGTKQVGGISGIIASQTLNGATVKNVTISCSDRAGQVAGSFGGTCTISNIAIEDVTGATVTIGATYKDGKPVQAKIGDTFYATLENALAAAQNSETVTLLADVATDAAIVVTKKVTIDLNGQTVRTTDKDTVGDGVFYVVAGGDLTINDSAGTGVVNGVGGNDYNMAIWANGGKVTVNGGTFTNEGATDSKNTPHFDLIYAKNGGEVVINGGYFKCETPNFTLNCHDASYNANNASIIVKGGTFYQFNPENNAAEGANTNFCDNGYIAVADGDTYTVYMVDVTSNNEAIDLSNAAKAAIARAAGGAKVSSVVAADGIKPTAVTHALELFDGIVKVDNGVAKVDWDFGITDMTMTKKVDGKMQVTLTAALTNGVDNTATATFAENVVVEFYNDKKLLAVATVDPEDTKGKTEVQVTVDLESVTGRTLFSVKAKTKTN